MRAYNRERSCKLLSLLILRKVVDFTAKKLERSINTSTQLKVGKKRTIVWLYLLLVVFSAFVIIPAFWLLSASFKTFAEVTERPWALPTTLHFENYIAAWKSTKFYQYLLNSLFVTILSIVITVISCTPLSFILSRFKFRLNKIIYYIVIAGMMVPIHSAIIPIYMTARELDMMNNLWYISFIYGAFRIPFSVFILEGFMSGIPKEMEESAFIDGATTGKMFLKIAVPLSRDGIVTIAIMTWISSWSELLISMLLLSKQKLKTVPTGLMGFIDEFNAEYTQLAAGIVIAIIPSILLFALAQKQIEKGLTAGSVKG